MPASYHDVIDPSKFGDAKVVLRGRVKQRRKTSTGKYNADYIVVNAVLKNESDIDFPENAVTEILSYPFLAEEFYGEATFYLMPLWEYGAYTTELKDSGIFLIMTGGSSMRGVSHKYVQKQ